MLSPFFVISPTDVDVPTDAAVFLFDLAEIRALIPVGFRIIVVGDGVEARALGLALSYDSIGHTDN